MIFVSFLLMLREPTDSLLSLRKVCVIAHEATRTVSSRNCDVRDYCASTENKKKKHLKNISLCSNDIGISYLFLNCLCRFLGSRRLYFLFLLLPSSRFSFTSLSLSVSCSRTCLIFGHLWGGNFHLPTTFTFSSLPSKTSHFFISVEIPLPSPFHLLCSFCNFFSYLSTNLSYLSYRIKTRAVQNSCNYPFA